MTALLILLAGGCADLFTFDLQASVDEFYVYGNPTLHHQHTPIQTAEVPPLELQLGGVSTGSVHLNSLLFYVTETAMLTPHDEDSLDFMTGMDVYVTPITPGAFVPLQIASWSGPAAKGAMVIDLEVNSDIDLSPYIKAGFALKVGPAGVVPYDDVSMKGELTFTVNPF